VAWMRMMGADSVAYHRATVLARGDDHPGQALAYYASRGETPLVWGGRGTDALGLEGAVSENQYEALFGPGGACDPTTGHRLVRTTRPGMELVISAHKSVAELGVIGRAEDMHAIMDAERDATLAYLDDVTCRMGGRRGRAAVRTPTEGLTYAITRHATSRAGDPCPHDHVLVANLVRMDDARGGWKAADTALWREHLHAATMVGRVAGARRAVELGYALRPDPGPSGRLGHWAVAGVPEVVMEAHSKRAAEIQAEVERTGHESYRARSVAARTTRDPKGHTAVGELLPRWRSEIEATGWSVERIAAEIDVQGAAHPLPAPTLNATEVREVVEEALASEGQLATRKVFSRRDVIVAVAPALYGVDPSALFRVVDRTLADPEAVPLIGVAGASERAHATASTIVREHAIAASVAAQAARQNAPAVSPDAAEVAMAAAEGRLGHPLTEGQRRAVQAVLTSRRGVELVVGVAGSGKTTALAAARDGFEAAGYEVVGTSSSGQAARTLGREAGITEARTLASLNWRIRHNALRLTDRHVAVLDEAAMADDGALVAFLEAAREAGAKVVAVGDPRQLGAVGPGGGFEALMSRFGDAVHVLDENVRQRDLAERVALEELRSGEVEAAVSWYADNDRIAVSPDRDRALDAVVAGWAADVAHGLQASMYAWRRANVAELNRRGREAWRVLGRLSGPELVIGGTAYQAGDRIVALAPGAGGEVVTSECGTVVAVDLQQQELIATMDDDGRTQRLGGKELDAAHLAHAYAVTVHRSQGATVERAHALEDGGGRELAYVKMSRAKERSVIYAVADSLEQAVEDLGWCWAHSRRIGWAIDSGTPAPEARPNSAPAAEVSVPAALRHARLLAERAALAAVVPADPGLAYGDAQARVGHLQRGLDELDQAQGRGVWRDTPVGDAAIAWRQAVTEQRSYPDRAENARLWERPQLHQQARRAAERQGPLREAFEHLAAPERSRIRAELPEAERVLADLDAQYYAHLHFTIAHPEALHRLERLDHQIAATAYDLGIHREGLDGIAPEPPPVARHPALARDVDAPDRGIGLGL
jgi:conjugative relaxase-like TrwC/TraI family protein